MLSCSRALEIPLLAEMAQSDPVVGQNPSFLLALVVLVERLRGTESKWASYLDLLPLTYSIPLFFSYGELAMLKECEHTWVGAKKMVVNAAMQYAYVHRMLSGLEKSGKEVSCVFFNFIFYIILDFLFFSSLLFSSSSSFYFLPLLSFVILGFCSSF